MRLTTAAPPRLAMNARRSISIGMKSLLLDRNGTPRPGSGAVLVACIGTVAARQEPVNRRSLFAWCALVRWCGAIALFGSAATLASAQPRDAVSESQVRGWVRQAARDRRGDPSEIVLEIDRRVRERWGDF